MTRYVWAIWANPPTRFVLDMSRKKVRGAAAATQSFTIVVANVDDQPVFTSTPETAAPENASYSYAIRRRTRTAMR